eukprot:XP_014778880.1 PREDICTED: 70 kDa neurofilament protein-like [Octopus bimaculoides]
MWEGASKEVADCDVPNEASASSPGTEDIPKAPVMKNVHHRLHVLFVYNAVRIPTDALRRNLIRWRMKEHDCFRLDRWKTAIALPSLVMTSISASQFRLRHVNDMNDQLQNNVDTLNDDISRRIADCEMLRRKVQELEKQLADWKTRHGHLDNQLQGLRIDLQEETAQRLGETNRAQALEEELAFLREVCENEIKEYKALLAKDNSVPDMREYWTSELGSCLKEIRQEYESQLEALSSSLEARYESQLCEMRLGATKGNAETIQMTEENRRLRAQKSDLENKLRECDTQISQLSNQLRAVTAELEMMTSDYDNEKLSHKADVDRLNAELEGVIKELQELMDAKLSLELEIAAYRKLLEGEESRISLGSLVQTLGGFRTESEDILASAFQRSGSSYQAISSADDSSICPASQGRITIHRTSAGSVSIMEVDATGQYIELEEISSAKLGRIQEPINLKGWSLERTFEDTKKALVHQFKEDFLFSPNKQIKVDVVFVTLEILVSSLTDVCPSRSHLSSYCYLSLVSYALSNTKLSVHKSQVTLTV